VTSRQDRIEAVRTVTREQPFAVFAFAGEAGAPPYGAIMFCAETEDLDLVFATNPASRKAAYLRDGNGAYAQLDTREVGPENMQDFARVGVQGRVHEVSDDAERARLHAVYTEKIPSAAVFLAQPGVVTWRLCPSRIVYARGFAPGFELEFPEA